MTHPIPIEAMDGKVGVLGITGSGKTFTAIGMVEQLLELGRQVIVIDPTGAYHGMTSAFPLPIFGGKAGDIPITESDGEAVARAIIDRGLSAIVDVSALLKESHAAARRFMAPFVATLKNSPAAPRYLVIDEADEFMPEHASGDVTRLFGDLKWIVRRGRIEGWRVMMVTQRPQDIAKSVLTQCETMVIHKLTAPQDRKAIEEWVKGNADAGQAKEVLGSLARLETGEAWIWSPRHDLLVKARLPLNRSADTSKTPEAGDDHSALTRMAPADLDAIRASMPKPNESETTPQSPARDAELERMRAGWAMRGEEIERLHETIAGYQRAFQAQATLLADISWPSMERRDGTMPSEPLVIAPVVSQPTKHISLPRKTVIRAPASTNELQKISPAALAIADLLDRVNPARLTWSQAATMTGRKASGGNFNSARKWLRDSGRIVEDGEFIRSASGAPAGLTRAEAIELWSSVLTNPAPRMIEAFESTSKWLSKEDLGALLGVMPRGGNFSNGLAQLRRNGLLAEESGKFCLQGTLPGERE